MNHDIKKTADDRAENAGDDERDGPGKRQCAQVERYQGENHAGDIVYRALLTAYCLLFVAVS